MIARGSACFVAATAVAFGLFGGCHNFGEYRAVDDEQGGRAGDQGNSGGSNATGSSPSTTGGVGGDGHEAGNTSTGGNEQGGSGAGGKGATGGEGVAGEGGGGDAAQAGMGGVDTNDCRPDESVRPDCWSVPPPSLGMDYTLNLWRSVALVARDEGTGSFELFAPDLRSDNALYTLQSCDTYFNCWDGWYCMDALPNPRRVVGTTLANDAPEIFATTECGRLYVRRFYLGGAKTGWSPWLPFDVPPEAEDIVDVATARLDSPELSENRVFAVDRWGRVYAAQKGEDAYADYTPMQEIATGAGAVIAAARHQDGRYRIFSIDENGHARSCLQGAADVAARCLDWQGFHQGFNPNDVPVFVDIDSPYGVGQKILVIALDEDGKLWTREDMGPVFGPWQPFAVQPPMDNKLVTISGAGIDSLPGAPLIILGINEGGGLYYARRTEGLWTAWQGIRR